MGSEMCIRDRAALLPNTFLQALVWPTLTTPEAELLPEVTEHESV